MSAANVVLIVLALISFVAGVFAGIWRSRCASTPTVSPKVMMLAAKLHALTTAVADDMGSLRHGMDCWKQQLSEIQAQTAQYAGTQALGDAIVAAISVIIERQSQMQAKLVEAETTLREQAAQIESCLSDARTDPLTGLLNRRANDEELARRFAQWTRHRASLSFLLLDVDRFKQLNDRYGHPAGDAVLRMLAEVLKKTSRAMDVVARYGGEEFSMILPASDLAVGKSVAERVRTAVDDCEFTYNGDELPVTISVGVAELMVGEDQADLVDRADTALYGAKRSGRNRSYFHNGRKVLPVLEKNMAMGVATTALGPGLGDGMSEAKVEASPELAGICSDAFGKASTLANEEAPRA